MGSEREGERETERGERPVFLSSSLDHSKRFALHYVADMFILYSDTQSASLGSIQPLK